MASITISKSLRSTLLSTTLFSPPDSFLISSLFAAGEPGQLMPVDPAYLYSDVAGSTPITAPGQPVGLWLDQSKELALGTELVTNGDFPSGITGWNSGDSAVLSFSAGQMKVQNGTGIAGSARSGTAMTTVIGRLYKATMTVTAGSGSSAGMRFLIGNSSGSGTVLTSIYGTGTVSAFFLATSTSTYVSVQLRSTVSGDFDYVDNISVKDQLGYHDTQSTAGSRPIYGKHPANGYRNMLYGSDTLVTQSRTVTAVAHTLSFTGTGTVTLSGASTAGPLLGTGASNRVSLTFTPTAGTLTLTVSGSVTLAQLEIGSTATAYQRTGATSGVLWPSPPSYDITEADQTDLHYLHNNGTNSSMVSSTITPNVDKIQVFAGVRKLSDVSVGTIAETGPNSGTASGSFGLNGPLLAGGNSFGFRSRGTSSASTTYVDASLAAPVTKVVTGLGDISGANAVLRLNATQVAQLTTSQGTGNYLAYPIYTGRRGGSSNAFTGLIYCKIIRFGANLTAAQITATESWVAQRTGVTL